VSFGGPSVVPSSLRLCSSARGATAVTLAASSTASPQLCLQAAGTALANSNYTLQAYFGLVGLRPSSALSGAFTLPSDAPPSLQGGSSIWLNCAGVSVGASGVAGVVNVSCVLPAAVGCGYRAAVRLENLTTKSVQWSGIGTDTLCFTAPSIEANTLRQFANLSTPTGVSPLKLASTQGGYVVFDVANLPSSNATLWSTLISVQTSVPAISCGSISLYTNATSPATAANNVSAVGCLIGMPKSNGANLV